MSRALERAIFATDRELLLARGRARPGDDMSTLPDKLGAIADTSRTLERLNVGHALIGGLAVGIHTNVPRATLDVDFAVDSRIDRDAAVCAMTAAGFQHTGTFAHSLNFRHESGEPVQLAMDPEFDPMLGRAETVEVGELTIRVVSKVDLIAMKQRAAADPKRRRSKALRDQADLALLLGDVPDPDEGW